VGGQTGDLEYGALFPGTDSAEELERCLGWLGLRGGEGDVDGGGGVRREGYAGEEEDADVGEGGCGGEVVEETGG
jgi:hypothetical protein